MFMCSFCVTQIVGTLSFTVFCSVLQKASFFFPFDSKFEHLSSSFWQVCSGCYNHMSFRQKQARNQRNGSGVPCERLREANGWIHAWRTSWSSALKENSIRRAAAAVNVRRSLCRKQLCHFWCFNCPQFSSHPENLSTHPVVLCVYLRRWAETTAARLITFPPTPWAHSRPVVFCCMVAPHADCGSAWVWPPKSEKLCYNSAEICTPSAPRPVSERCFNTSTLRWADG